MYQEHFGFHELPFSIVPNSRYLFLSHRHQEAMTYLKSGLGDGGGFALLTGEVGTGKTTVAKAVINDLSAQTQCGSLLNPTFSIQELLASICDEFSISYPESATLKQLRDRLNQFLLEQDAQGHSTLLVIDEAQHLTPDVLEQLRLLTNLETEQRKLLKVLLVGQPELQNNLQLPQLRQLAQRITARYHILPLDNNEVNEYLQFRLQRAGGDPDLFPAPAKQWIAKHSHGIPRLINLIGDATLKLSYQQGKRHIELHDVKTATTQVMSFQSTVYQQPQTERWVRPSQAWQAARYLGLGGLMAAALVVSWQWTGQALIDRALPMPDAPQPVVKTVLPQAINQALTHATDKEAAITTLFALWGYQASVSDTLCQNNERQTIQCQAFHGDWAEIKKFNRPVVLKLTLPGTEAYAILNHIERDEVEVLIDGKAYRVQAKWLLPYWQGQYWAVWQHQFTRTLKEGMQGQDVVQLNHTLATLLREPIVQSSTFDKTLKHKVMTFQRWQHMTVDGVAGMQTLQRIDRLNPAAAPTLQNQRLSSQQNKEPLDAK
ncbi:ExeA family protein [Vibrio palustris]|uniref:Putative general secretion pathway protein A n=1 Tax=Vibrio palustris TaxID=1918946 RepID=A0A1R4B8Y5_9VIBR|nr:ExeA family protein [Vibrio palustris]SJL85390.1 Putative general secretion pathway protein A [Vibrio palustris]